MMLLTIFQDPKETGIAGSRSFVLLDKSLEEAVRIGQECGQFYEIFDFATGRNIDWNEVNYRGEEEWFYDEEEMLWKKHPAGTMPAEPFVPGEANLHCYPENQGPALAGDRSKAVTLRATERMHG
jgi:hypothetical protein